jgi:hypothetical protein
MPPSAPALLPRCPPRSKIEAQTRQVLSGKDINDLYDGEAAAVEESFAEGDGVLREQVAG